MERVMAAHKVTKVNEDTTGTIVKSKSGATDYSSISGRSLSVKSSLLREPKSSP